MEMSLFGVARSDEFEEKTQRDDRNLTTSFPDVPYSTDELQLKPYNGTFVIENVRIFDVDLDSSLDARYK